ncbi:hypothetical protein OAE37_00035 [Pirellulaceae bacterium]|nr:hypothetical protein [Pirellulaceae bacterium]
MLEVFFVLVELFLVGFRANLSDKIFAEAARELVVAARIAKLSDYDPATTIHALQTLGPALNIFQTVIESRSDQQTAHWLEDTFEQSDGGYPLPWCIECKICGSDAHEVTDGILQMDGNNEYFELSEFYCPSCELELRPTYLDERDQEQELVTALLRIHYGRITPFNLNPLQWKKLKEITGKLDDS